MTNKVDCIFCKIIDKEIPSKIIFENDFVVAFADIMPVNLGHILVVPKKHSTNVFDIDESDWVEVQKVVRKLAKIVKEATGACGVNINNNNGECSGQIIMHPHIHIIPRYKTMQ